MEQFVTKYAGEIITYTKTISELIPLNRSETLQKIQDKSSLTMTSALSVLFLGVTAFFVFSKTGIEQKLVYSMAFALSAFVISISTSYISMRLGFKHFEVQMDTDLSWRACLIYTSLMISVFALVLLFLLGFSEVIYSLEANGVFELPNITSGRLGWIEWVCISHFSIFFVYLIVGNEKYFRWIAQIHRIRNYKKFSRIAGVYQTCIGLLAVPLIIACTILIGIDLPELLTYMIEVFDKMSWN